MKSVWLKVIAVEIAFAKRALRQLCESERTARRSLGHAIAERLKRRLADLRAAKCVTDLVAGRPKEIQSTQPGRMVIDLGEGFQLIFCANHDQAPLTNGLRVDWSKVNRVKILSIASDHVR